MDNLIKYFSAADLINYAGFVPLHLAKMNQTETDDPLTLEAIKSGAFVISKSDVPCTSMFTDQNLEQKSKDLKRPGGFVWPTQYGGSLDRLVPMPFLSRIVRNFLSSFPSSSTSSTGMDYQLSGDVAVRFSQNALKIRDCTKIHCEEIPLLMRLHSKTSCRRRLRGLCHWSTYDRLKSIHLGSNEEAET